MTSFLRRVSARRVQVVSWILFAGVLYPVAFARRIPFSAAYVAELTGVKVLDVRFAFGPDEGAAAVAALGEAGRRHHGYYQLADLGFAAVYAVALSGGLYALSGRKALAVIPLAGAVADFAEDIGVLVALQEFPAPARGALAMAGAAGVVKHLCFWPSLVAVAVLAASRISRRPART